VAIHVCLDKERIEYLTTALAYAQPIAPDNNAHWTPDDVIVLGGAGLYAALRHGPRAYRCASRAGFAADLNAAIGWVADELARAAEGGYDQDLRRRHASQRCRRWSSNNPLYYLPRFGPQAPAPWP
jgi:hypothetical protein